MVRAWYETYQISLEVDGREGYDGSLSIHVRDMKRSRFVMPLDQAVRPQWMSLARQGIEPNESNPNILRTFSIV